MNHLLAKRDLEDFNQRDIDDLSRVTMRFGESLLQSRIS